MYVKLKTSAKALVFSCNRNAKNRHLQVLKTWGIINKAEFMVTIFTHTLCCVSVPHDLIQSNKHQDHHLPLL